MKHNKQMVKGLIDVAQIAITQAPNISRGNFNIILNQLESKIREIRYTFTTYYPNK